jgi:restriction system protein
MDKDILYSLGAVMTICEISRNDAEARIRRMLQLPPAKAPLAAASSDVPREEAAPAIDYELLARDEIAALVIRRFKGHGMERLVDAILRAQGYVTYHSPSGADRGVDILAGSGDLGFASPRICVQVKSEQAPVDHPTFSQLLGTMQAVGAEQGLLVSWGGFQVNRRARGAAPLFQGAPVGPEDAARPAPSALRPSGRRDPCRNPAQADLDGGAGRHGRERMTV